MKRRELLQGLGASSLLFTLPRVGQAMEANFKLRNKIGQKILLDSLNDANFWDGVEVERPTDALYDEFKIKPLDQGYLTHVSGEGQTNF